MCLSGIPADDIVGILYGPKSRRFNEMRIMDPEFFVLVPEWNCFSLVTRKRTYDFACALRAVTSVDGMTADYYPFSHEFLGETATRIINEIKGINRVTYDITSKPPGTIEWE